MSEFGPQINPEDYAHEKGDFTDVYTKEFQDEFKDELAEEKESELSPEIEAKIMKKVQDIKYAIDHWHDPNEIIDPLSKFSKGGASGNSANSILNTEFVIARPIYYRENDYTYFKAVSREGETRGSIGIMPFYYSNYGTNPRRALELAESTSIEDYDASIAELKGEQNTGAKIGRTIPICNIFGGKTAESLRRIALEHKQRIAEKGQTESYYTTFGELSFSNKDPEMTQGLRQLNPRPSATIIGLIPTEQHLEEFVGKRKIEIARFTDIKKMMIENGLDEYTPDPDFPYFRWTIDSIEKAIHRQEDEIDYLKFNAEHGKEKRLELAQTVGEISKLPVFDLEGNLLWPRQMSYEEVKQFVAERDQNKQLYSGSESKMTSKEE